MPSVYTHKARPAPAQSRLLDSRTIVPVAMSLPDCARYMDVALRSVYVLIENGELPSFKIGRARRVLVADVDALLARKVREASL